MKTILSSAAMLLLGGFAFGASGCVTEYQTVSTTTAYAGTTLPAASRVALVMEFRGGTPSPEERADVRAILSDYLTGKGSVLVDEPSAADYLVHVVLERRNPASPEEWTVVDTYSAHSLSSVYGDDYDWPGGIVEDDSYLVTTYSHIGFGAFYPIWFDAWDSPWHRGHLRICPPPRHHDRYRDNRWREERRHHRPDRWQKDRRPDANRGDNRRDDRDRKPDNDRRDRDRRPGIDHRGDNHRPDAVRPPEKRNDRHGGTHPRPERPGNVVHPAPALPSPESPWQTGVRPQPTTPSRPHGRPVPHQPAQVRPTPPPQNPPAVRPTDNRPRTIAIPGQGVMVTRPPSPPPSAQPAPSSPPRGDRDRPRMERRNGADSRHVTPQPKRNDHPHQSPRELRQTPPPKDDSKDNKDENQQRH